MNLTCNNCGASYALGKNAMVVTSEDVLGMFASGKRTVMVGDMPTYVMVAHPPGGTCPQNVLDEAKETILRLGPKRGWECGKCHQNNPWITDAAPKWWHIFFPLKKPVQTPRFDAAKYGRVTREAHSSNENLCIAGAADDIKHWGMVRKSQLLEFIEEAGVDSPPKELINQAAAMMVFRTLHLSEAQAVARESAKQHLVFWHESATKVIETIEDESWHVPIALVVFKREW